jgi:hypothetical protein
MIERVTRAFKDYSDNCDLVDGLFAIMDMQAALFAVSGEDLEAV